MQESVVGDYFDILGKAQKLYTRFLEPVCRAQGLNRTEVDVLLFLYNHPAFDRAADIVDRRGIAKSHVSLSLKNLEELGLLERRLDLRDRRSARLALTPAGRSVAEAGRQRQERFFEALYAGVRPEELEAWRRLTKKVIENIQSMEETE